MTTMEDEGQTLDVWMDGDCRICRLSQRWSKRRDPEGHVKFHDFRLSDDRSIPVARRDLEESMWVQDGDGRLFAGFAAWRRIMAELPGWRWLASLGGLPPVSWVGPTLYRLIARNRHRLPLARAHSKVTPGSLSNRPSQPRSGGIFIAWGVSPRNTMNEKTTSREAATDNQ